MRLILDPAAEAAHRDWLREAAGAYEWWYFDAVSDDGAWALTCIWFLGNPFSPYYRLAATGRPADPISHNALFFALYHRGRLDAYHFTRFPAAQVCADPQRPATLRFAENTLDCDAGTWRLRLSDENANRRRLTAALDFTAPPLVPQPPQADAAPDAAHFWLPVAPACRVQGQIAVCEVQNPGARVLRFTGHGYHDHNWGTLPFARDIRDWYWTRAALGPERALVLYHVRPRTAPPVRHLLLFDGGRCLWHETAARVNARRRRLNGLGALYATELWVDAGERTARFHLGARLDSAPFYIRALCRAELTANGRTEMGDGIGEYFRPRMLSWPLVASATKARIVER